MEKIEFKNIHNVIIDFLNEEDNNELEIIGSWYFRFLKSDKEKLSLYIPYYSVEFTKLAYIYIRSFTVVFNLLKQERITQFSDTCLFDIFNEYPRPQMNDLTLNFRKQKDNLALWGDGTLTKLDSFLPVFNKEEILQFNKLKTIKNTFNLFKSIRNFRIIDFPQQIELQEKILTFNNIGDNIDDELISENLFLVDNNLDDDSAMELEEKLIRQELNNSITIRFPYSKKPHDYLKEVGKNKFKLVFNNRFVHNDIQENDIFLLKDESKLLNKLKYHILNTNHSKKLYDLFKDIKGQWNDLELNKYTTPFPKYWFLLINNSISKEKWLNQFKIAFPAVAEKTIINKVEDVINELVDLNWIKEEITEFSRILLPELNGLRKKRLEFVYNNFKNYIHTINPAVVFITTIENENIEKIVLLDSFNIIDLVNINQNLTNSKISVIVPDFLYFGYQPWIKYHLFNYNFSPLLNGLRGSLDNNFENNKQNFEKLRKEIINEIQEEFKIYKSKYKEIAKKDEHIIEVDENPSEEDLKFSNVEEIENADLKNKNTNQTIIINKNLENELSIFSTEKVLLQKSTLLYIKSGLLKVGDYFIRNSDVAELYKADRLYDKLVNIPQEILNYQTKLSAFNNTYQILKHKGISYQHKNYFDVNYVIDEPEEGIFRIPRRKKDWAIICEFLNINQSIQQLAFIAYYGRSKQNELKKMYKSIIDLLLENNWIGTIEDSNIITSVSEIVNQHNNIFSTSETTEITGISESIISTLLDQLSFTEIKTIEIIENE